MAAWTSRLRFLAPSRELLHLPLRSFSVSSSACGKVVHWREEHGLPRTGTEYGPLTDLPDWSYADGRPGPLGEGQKRRILKQREYLRQIIKLTKEVDEAKQLSKERKEQEVLKRKIAVETRLKAKGDSELKMKSSK